MPHSQVNTISDDLAVEVCGSSYAWYKVSLGKLSTTSIQYPVSLHRSTLSSETLYQKEMLFLHTWY